MLDSMVGAGRRHGEVARTYTRRRGQAAATLGFAQEKIDIGF